MQINPLPNDPTSPDCFQQWELELFQTFENTILNTVNYYLWRTNKKSSFLFALELFFENGKTLLLSSGEDSEQIQVITPESLTRTAKKLQLIHDEALIQRIAANIQPLWRDLIGTALQGIRLSIHAETGLYRNDAMLLEFDGTRILLELSEKDGLLLGQDNFE
ncbi:MAG: hypothetical protein ACKVT2_19460 [Saprospiraceae bacterium]